MIDLKKRLAQIDGVDRIWSPDQRLRVISMPADKKINPFYDDGLRISTAMGCDLSPHQNIKIVTVLGIFLDALERGKFVGVKELVESTSGNTGISMIPLAMLQGIERLTFIVERDLAVGKRDPLELSFLGDLKFDYAEGNLSGIATARKRGGGGYTEDGSWTHCDGVFNLDQYANPHGADLHDAYTGEEILQQVPDITLYVGGVGTGGTNIGVMRRLHRSSHEVKALGVLCAPGQKIPGVRDLDRMKDVTLPWREALDTTIEIDTRQGYLMTLWLIRLIGEMFGPSGGFAYAGLLKFIHSCKTTGDPFNLDDLRIKQGPKKGLIEAVVMIPDSYRPYVDHFKSNLPAEFLSPEKSPLPTSLLW